MQALYAEMNRRLALSDQAQRRIERAQRVTNWVNNRPDRSSVVAEALCEYALENDDAVFRAIIDNDPDELGRLLIPAAKAYLYALANEEVE